MMGQIECIRGASCTPCRNRLHPLVGSALAAFLTLLPAALPAVAAPPASALLAEVPLSDADRATILKGDLLTTTAPESSERELVTVMVFLTKRSPSDVVGVFRAAQGYKKDPQVTAFGRIKGDGSLGDFKGVVLKPNTSQAVQQYLNAKPGAELNLSTAEIAAFDALKAPNQSPAEARSRVEAQVRSMLLARFKAYRAGGLPAIAPYDRGDRPSQPAVELRRATDMSPLLAQYAPAFKAVLLSYPRDKPARLEEEFLWINYNIDDLPTISLSHRMALPMNNGYVVADRHYYVSRSHNSVQEVAALLSVEEGTLAIYVNRTSTDQVGGFGASAKRAIGNRLMAKQLTALFQKVRAAQAAKK